MTDEFNKFASHAFGHLEYGSPRCDTTESKLMDRDVGLFEEISLSLFRIATISTVWADAILIAQKNPAAAVARAYFPTAHDV
jgi:hypothetical protein